MLFPSMLSGIFRYENINTNLDSSIALVMSAITPILIAGDLEGNISMWRTNAGSMIHRSHSLPLPSVAEASARDGMSASARTPKAQNDFEEKKVRRRSKVFIGNYKIFENYFSGVQCRRRLKSKQLWTAAR